MGFYKISDDLIINLDHVTSIMIMDLPSDTDENEIKWHLIFETKIIDSVKHFTLSPDEDMYETSAYKNDEYEYRSYKSKGFSTVEEAEEEMNALILYK